jgi:hypothetical protein
MGAIFLILFIVGIAVGIYKIGSKSADDAKAIGKYDIEDLQRREHYDYADSEEEEEYKWKIPENDSLNDDPANPLSSTYAGIRD